MAEGKHQLLEMRLTGQRDAIGFVSLRPRWQHLFLPLLPLTHEQARRGWILQQTTAQKDREQRKVLDAFKCGTANTKKGRGRHGNVSCQAKNFGTSPWPLDDRSPHIQKMESGNERLRLVSAVRECGGFSLDFKSGTTNVHPFPGNRGKVSEQRWHTFGTSAWLRPPYSHRGRKLESGKQRFRQERVPAYADEDWFLLAKPTHTEDGLHLTCGVPRGVQEYHTVGTHKIGAQWA